MGTIKKYFGDTIAYGFEYYKNFLFGLIIGLFIAWFYHKYIGNRSLKKSYENLLSAKEDTINAYKEIIGGRLLTVEVEKKDKEWFSRLRKFFRANTKVKA